MKKTFVLRTPEILNTCVEYLKELTKLPREGNVAFVVKITEERQTKSRLQEEKYHSILADMAPQFTFMGITGWPMEDVKRLMIDAFARIKAAEGEPLRGWGRVVPSLCGTGIVQLGCQSRDFTVKQGSEFIEYLHSYCAENNIKLRM
jgi:hypothetical protein